MASEVCHVREKVLVAGASGLVGFAALKHFSQLADWDAVGVSRRIPPGLEGAKLISVDLTDSAWCVEIFGQMRDVTHVVYAALYEKPGLIQGWRERDQMESNLAMLRNLSKVETKPWQTDLRLDMPAGLDGFKGFFKTVEALSERLDSKCHSFPVSTLVTRITSAMKSAIRRSPSTNW